MSGSVACGPKDIASSMSVNNGIQLSNFKNLSRKISHHFSRKYEFFNRVEYNLKIPFKGVKNLERFEFIS